MSTITLEALGFTKEELQARVIDQLCRQIMTSTGCDEDGEETQLESALSRRLEEKVKTQLKDGVDAFAAKHLLPNVVTYLESLVLQETNKWGEKRGEPVTFKEYLIQRADAYMREEVDYKGKTKDQDSYNWRRATTRVAYLINEHLHYSIESAMKQALANANTSVAKGLEDAVKVAISKVTTGLTVTVKTDTK